MAKKKMAEDHTLSNQVPVYNIYRDPNDGDKLVLIARHVEAAMIGKIIADDTIKFVTNLLKKDVDVPEYGTEIAKDMQETNELTWDVYMSDLDDLPRYEIVQS